MPRPSKRMRGNPGQRRFPNRKRARGGVRPPREDLREYLTRRRER